MLLSDMTSSTAPRGDMMTDVFIAGSGPIGATFAKKFVEAGHNVVMVEIGAADSVVSRPPPQQAKSTEHDNRGFVPNLNWSVVPGYHKKNEIEYQKDIDRFVNVIKGALSTVSVPTSNVAIPTLDPLSFQNTKEKPFISLGKNPAQNPFENLGAEAVTRGVGGMTTHWTCATPEFHPVLERPKLDENPATNDEIWAKLYKEAKGLIGTSTHEFDQSIRHTLVLDTYKKLHEKTDRRAFEPLPLACHRLDDPDYVEWHAADRILETLFTDPEKKKKFTLLTNHRCIRVRPTHYNAGQTNNIGYAEVENLMPHMTGQKDNAKFKIRAKVYVIACGAVATAQILANSNVPEDAQPGDGGNRDTSDDIIETPLMPNLGHYITEQPMAFCQVVLNGDLIKSVGEDLEHKPTWWSEKVKKHLARHPNDPIPIPFRDPEPQVTTRVSDIHPWHTQIHRDAFSYGAVAENIDTRLIVDFRFFGMVEPREQNRIVFQKHYRDAYNMPQPTFRFQMSKNDSERARTMMDDMCKLALEIGGFLPGSEPQFMTPGLALHLGGTTRTGLEKDKNKTVADTNSQVWNFTNLFVGGNNVIPTAFAANPTLTSICYAIRSADHINKNWSTFK